MLYTETDLEESMEKIETINFHEVKEVAGIKFWCYHAGHVLGAAMFMIEIAGVKVRSGRHAEPPVGGPSLTVLPCAAVVHGGLLPAGGQTPDGSRDPQRQTRHPHHGELRAPSWFRRPGRASVTQPVWLGVDLRDSHPREAGGARGSVL